MYPHSVASRVAVGVLAIVTAWAGAGCSDNDGNDREPDQGEAFTVAGLPVTDGPTGPREGVPDAERPVENVSKEEADRLAVNAVADIEDYWREHYPLVFNEPFVPVETFTSWDSTEASDVTFCGDPGAGNYNAAFCHDEGIGWDRGGFFEDLIVAYGPIAPVVVMAHEYGHAMQFAAGIVGRTTPTIVKEQQADCFAGAFLRYIAEDKAVHFTLNTSDGLNDALATTEAIRDPLYDAITSTIAESGQHGNAFERVSATQAGFTDGATACTKINEDEIRARRGDLPQFPSEAMESGEVEVTEESVNANIALLQEFFEPKTSPTVEYSTSAEECDDATPTDAVSYCPASNTITVDVADLADRATQGQREVGQLSGPDAGDFNAYILLASRYALAAMNEREVSLTGPLAALRAVCYAGAWTGYLALGTGEVTLAAGDLDEAVNGLLTDGLVASDVDGETAPSGFARVEALRTGVLGGVTECDTRYA